MPLGQEYVEGINCNHWENVSSLQRLDLWVDAKNPANPIQYRTTSVKGDSNQVNFRKFVPGRPDPSVFTIPKYCQKN